MTGYWQKAYQKILNNAALVTPDGMPLVWAMRLLGVTKQIASIWARFNVSLVRSRCEIGHPHIFIWREKKNLSQTAA